MSRAPLLLAVLAVVLATVASAGASPTRRVANCTKSAVRPSRLTIFCADDNASLTHLSWSSWGGAVARAKGRLDYDDCKPNCAAGTLRHVAATAALSGTITCKGKPFYRDLTVHFTHAVPAGYKRTEHYSPGCLPG